MYGIVWVCDPQLRPLRPGASLAGTFARQTGRVFVGPSLPECPWAPCIFLYEHVQSTMPCARRVYTHTPLRKETFTHRSFYTEKSFTQMGFTQSLATDQLCAVTKSHFATVFDVRPSFRAKSLHLNLQNSNFTFYTNFGIRPSFGAKGGLHSTPDKIQHFTTRLCARYAPSPQKVAFRKQAFGCPCCQKREFRRT